MIVLPKQTIWPYHNNNNNNNKNKLTDKSDCDLNPESKELSFLLQGVITAARSSHWSWLSSESENSRSLK